MHCKSLWIKVSAKCINVNVNMHTVKIISVYVHILPKPHTNVLYFLNENEKRVALYLEENEKAVVFDIVFLWLLIFLMK